MKAAQAYARIVGRVGTSTEYEPIDEPVLAIPVTMGRGECTKAGETSHICVGKKENTISRKHIKIYYEEERKSYMIQCLSKNGLIVDGKAFSLNEAAQLQSKSAVRFGVARFYFLLPKKDTEKQKGDSPKISTTLTPYMSYADMLEAAYQSSHLDLTDGGPGASQREIIDWILSNYPNFGEENKKQNLQQGIYVALNKYYNRVPTPGEKSKIRWTKKTPEHLAADEKEQSRKRQKLS